MLEVVERAGEDEEHLLVQARDIVPDHEDNGAELTSNRDGVLGVQLLFLVSLAFGNQVPVDDAWFNVACHLDQDLAISETWISEVGKRSLRLANFIAPGEQVGIRLVSNNLHVVCAHKLPDHGQNVLLVSIADILCPDSNHAYTECLHSCDGQVTVVIVVEHILRGELWLRPVDGGVINSMADAQDDQTIADFLKEVLHEAVLDLHGVDPETKSAFLAGTFDIIVNDTSSLKLLLSQFLQAVLAVEDGSDKDRVDLCVTLAEIGGSQAVLHAHCSGACEHLCSPLSVISLFKSIESAVARIELVQDVDKLSAVREISSQVCNLFLACGTQMEVHPADKNLFRFKLLEVSELFTILEQAVNFFALTKIDGLH